jgi:hypothetical protein
MQTTTSAVRHYEVCYRDAQDVSVVHYTTKHYDQAKACARLLPQRYEPRILAVYSDDQVIRVY